MKRRSLLVTGLATAALPRRAFAQRKPIRIGVLTDMAGPYAANTGQGSVAGAQLAIDDFVKSHPSIKVELVSGDLQLKPDIAVTHYLKAIAAVGVDKAKASGKAVLTQMKAMPTDDPIFGKGMIRADGRKIHDMHLFEVKSPAQSKEPWDYYIHKRTVPAAEAFRPIAQGNCPLTKA